MKDNVTLKGARWWKEVGWKHILAVVLMIYCVFPLLYVVSASLNPGARSAVPVRCSASSHWRITSRCSAPTSRAGCCSRS